MKKAAFSFLGLIGVVAWAIPVLYAQQTAKDVFDQAAKLSTIRYQLQPGQVTLGLRFGQHVALNHEVLSTLKKEQIRKIELVYSDYPKGASFEELNRQRIAQLLKLMPELAAQPQIQWSVVKQTDCPSREDAEQLFHGFVFSQQAYEGTLAVDYQKNISYIKEIFLSLPPEDRYFLAMGKDTLAYDVLERNREHWKHVTIISDWTASMYAHTTQVLRWHLARIDESRIINFIFFNDGDHKQLSEKVVGSTGGIYATKSKDYLEVIRLMRHVKEMGDGGDLPENDMEAIIYAIEHFPESENFVLIADNRSDIRDFELLEKINRPIHIILARVFLDNVAYIKGQYLHLAMKTGGTIHTRFYDYTTPQALEQLKREIIEARRKLRGKPAN